MSQASLLKLRARALLCTPAWKLHARSTHRCKHKAIGHMHESLEPANAVQLAYLLGMPGLVVHIQHGTDLLAFQVVLELAQHAAAVEVPHAHAAVRASCDQPPLCMIKCHGYLHQQHGH